MIGDKPFYDIINYTDSYGNKTTRKRENLTFPVLNSKIETGEVINKTNHVYINGLYEIGIQNEITSENYFKVKYETGTIFVHPSKNNTNLTLTYYGEAQICYRASNVTIEDVNNNYASDNVEDALKENADRFNNLILNTSNPAEVTDAHLDNASGITYNVLGSRLDKYSGDIIDLQNNKVGNKNLDQLSTTNKNSLIEAINENAQEIINTRNKVDYLYKYATLSTPTGTTKNYVVIPHNLGFIPRFEAYTRNIGFTFANSANKIVPLPVIEMDGGIDVMIQIKVTVDVNNFYLEMIRGITLANNNYFNSVECWIKYSSVLSVL